MIFPKKCLGCPPFLGYICWPKVIGALLLPSAPLPYFLSGVPFNETWGGSVGESGGRDHLDSNVSNNSGNKLGKGNKIIRWPPKV